MKDRQLDVVVGRALGTVLLTVRGPLKKGSAPLLTSSLREILRDNPERVVIDLTGVPELDADGAAALRRARRAAERSEVQLQLTSRTPQPLEALGEAGAADEFTVV